MYLWDTNILRAFTQGDTILMQHLAQKSWSEIALPSVVVAEVLQGRCDAVLKAIPADAPMMIAATVLAGRHILVTRNQRDFIDLLPKSQLVNWIDFPPN